MGKWGSGEVGCREVGCREMGRPLRARCGGGVGRWGSYLITLSPQNPITP
ncbi:hypothetical protein RVR34_00575 [Microcystis aeruginosa FBCC-A68]